MTKEQAIVKIMKVLNSSMDIMSKPLHYRHIKEEALTLAEEYGITAKDLIEQWTRIAEKEYNER